MEELSKNGDPLVQLKGSVDWELFRQDLEVIRVKDRKSPAGRKPLDVVLMFKIFVLQSLYNLSDDAIEYQIRDRLSFMRFLDFSLGNRVPVAKTIRLFREQLHEVRMVKRLFKRFDRYLNQQGFKAKKGQIVDASLVSVPLQRNSREENARIKEGDAPDDWSTSKRRQKDVTARWSARSHKHAFGYKNHISIDADKKFISDYAVTDSAYRTPRNIADLEARGYREHLQRKGCKHRKLTTWERQGNQTRSRIRCRIEHVFGVQVQIAGNLILRTIGIARAETKIGLRNPAYNMHRLGKFAPATG